MKIYFTAAISYKDKFGENYKRIVDFLSKQGHKVIADHILKSNLNEILSESDEGKVEYYKKFLRWLNESDMVVAEASFPSTIHIGHEISLALEKGKPVIALYLKGKEPVFLRGISSDKLFVESYEQRELERVLKEALDCGKDQMDIRFNFFIPPQIANYLDWIAKNRKLPRSVFLRGLLEREMEKDKEYQKSSS